MRKVLLHGLMILASCCFMTGCRQAPDNTKEESNSPAESKISSDEIILSTQAQSDQKIEVAPVEQGTALLPQRAKGRIVLPDNATWRVGVLAEGRVEKVYFNLGDYVSKDQVLARMHSHDVHEVRADYANALAERSRFQAAEALAQKNYERSLRLYALKAESTSQTEEAKQELVNAQSATREADNNVHREKSHIEEILGIPADAPDDGSPDFDLIPIKAPASGWILQKNVTPGATISASTDAFVIGDLSRLWMLASVDAPTLSKLHVGQDATISLADEPAVTRHGKITNLGQEFDPVTRLMQVRIEISNPDARLRPEMLANAEFETGDGAPSLFVPQEAIQQVNGEDVVFTRLTPERFKVQAVRTAETLQDKVRITSGLAPGQQVIIRGSFLAKSQLLKSSIGD
jgi:multidrug efflux pump subunit AcrA (membrane-fusion protein)